MQTIDLDVSRADVPVTLTAKQGDVGRKFCARILDNGQPYILPEGVALSVWYMGTSGMGNYSSIGGNSAFTVSENCVTVELITQMLSNKGGGTLCLLLHCIDGSQIGLWNIPYTVEPVPGMESQAAQKYYTALSEAASQAADAADRVYAALESITVDTTLTMEGQPAEAAAAGSRITALEGRYPHFSTYWWTSSGSDTLYGLLQSNWSSIVSGTFTAHMTINGVAYAQFGYKHDNYGVALMIGYSLSLPYVYVIRNVNGVWTIRKVSDGGAV